MRSHQVRAATKHFSKQVACVYCGEVVRDNRLVDPDGHPSSNHT